MGRKEASDATVCHAACGAEAIGSYDSVHDDDAPWVEERQIQFSVFTLNLRRYLWHLLAHRILHDDGSSSGSGTLTACTTSVNQYSGHTRSSSPPPSFRSIPWLQRKAHKIQRVNSKGKKFGCAHALCLKGAQQTSRTPPALLSIPGTTFFFFSKNFFRF
jgi:hypothetical protein